MSSITIYGYMRDNKVHLNNELYSKKQIADLKGNIKIVFSEIRKRSNQQNAYLHGILIPEFRRALYQAGWDEISDDVRAKNLMKLMFLKSTIPNSQTGEAIEFIRDTSDLTKEEMGDLYDRVIRFCAEKLSYIIPYPNEKLQLYPDEEGQPYQEPF
jgi:hypothetical protein